MKSGAVELITTTKSKRSSPSPKKQGGGRSLPEIGWSTPQPTGYDHFLVSLISPIGRTYWNCIELEIHLPNFPNGALHNETEAEDSVAGFEFVGGNVHLITTKESWEEKLSQASKEGKIVIANFSASWCRPCRQVAALYSELSEKYPSLMFLTVDVDEVSELSTSWDIKATPTFFFLRDGQQIDKLVGANRVELEKKVTAIGDSLGS
ncbi:Thioredoxin H-type-like protein [Drosera capensis]